MQINEASILIKVSTSEGELACLLHIDGLVLDRASSGFAAELLREVEGAARDMEKALEVKKLEVKKREGIGE